MAKISELPEVLAPVGTEDVPIVSAGIAKRTKLSYLLASAAAPSIAQALAAAALAAQVVNEQGRGPINPNRFDLARATAGQAVQADGTLGVAAAYTASDAIPVIAGATYVFSRRPAQLAFYTGGDVFVPATYQAPASGGIFTGSINGNTFTVTGVTTGSLAIGTPIDAPGSPGGVEIQAFGTGSGGVGTYTLSKAFGTALPAGTTIYGGFKVVVPGTAARVRFSQTTANSDLARQGLYAGSALPALYTAAAWLDPAADLRAALDAALATGRRLIGTTGSVLDPTQTTDGYAMGANGAPYALAGWFVTPFIAGIPGDQFIANFSSGANGAWWYDESGRPLYPFTITANTTFGPMPSAARSWRAQSSSLATKVNCKAWLGTAVPSGSPGFPSLDPAAQARVAILQARLALDIASPGSRNLFDKTDANNRVDMAIASNGAIYAFGGYGVTHRFEVTGGVPHVSNYGSAAGQIVYFDENMAIINSGTNYSVTAGVPFVPPTPAFWAQRSISNWAARLADMYVYKANYATGTISLLAGQPAVGDWVAPNGVQITFVAGGAVGPQINIGANTTATAAALNAYINANSATLGVTSVVSSTPAILTLTSVGVGPSANGITLAKSGANISVSGATMSGARPASLAYTPFGGVYPPAAAGKSIGFFGNSQTAFGYYQGNCLAIAGALLAFSKGHPGYNFGGLADIFATDFPNLAALNNADMVWVTEGHNEWAGGGRLLGTVEDSANANTVGGKLRSILEQFLALKRTIVVGFTGVTYRGYFTYDSGGGVMVTVNPDTTVGPGGYTGAQLDDFIRAFCKRWGLPFADLRATSMISELTDLNNVTNTGLKTHTLDALHWSQATGGRNGDNMGAVTNMVL
jgi:hypothetical protein